VPRVWPGFFAVWAAVLLHLTWCVLLLLPDTHAPGATPVYEVVRLAGSPWRAAVLLGSVALTAMWGALRRLPPGLKIYFLLPQQLVLGISAAGSILAMYNSHYADGVPRAASFIIADQLAVVLTWMFHTLAILYLYAIHTRRLSLGGVSGNIAEAVILEEDTASDG
jgi:hypothetical protein